MEDPPSYRSSATSGSQHTQTLAPVVDFVAAPIAGEQQSGTARSPGLTYHEMSTNPTPDPDTRQFGADDLFPGMAEASRHLTDWDFGSANDLFDLGSNMDFVLSDPDIDFLASIPRLPASSDAGVLASSASGPISRRAQPASEAVVEAYKQSVGRWSPERRNYRAAAESALSLEPAKSVFLGKYNPRVFNESLTTGIRDQILGVIVKSCEQDNMVHIVSYFPGLEVLDQLLKVFVTWHAMQTESWIHVPTFKLEETRIELLLACIGTAAVMSSSRPVQKFGMAIQEFLVFHLWQASEKKNTLIRDLQFLQAFALHIQMGTWSGIRRKMEMCGSFMNILTNSLRGGGRYRYASYTRPVPCPEDEGEVLEAKWKQWVQEESFKRLVYCLYIHSCQDAAINSGIFLVSYSELSLPLPLNQKLWFAQSARDWKQIYLGMSASEPARTLSVIDLLADPSKLKSLSMLYDRVLSQHIVVYALSTMVRRYGQDKAVFLLNDHMGNREMVLSDEAQQRAIRRLLDEVRTNCGCDDTADEPALAMILESLSMHLFSPFDQIELVAGREGTEESRLAYPLLHRWIQTSDARQAIWHAGQVLSAMRNLVPEQLCNFYAVVAYHAALCVWAYGVISQDNGDAPVAASTIAPSAQNKIMIDGEESIQTQRWIGHNLGSPMIMGLSNSLDTSTDLEPIPLASSGELIDTVLRTVMAKFASKNSVLVDNICNLMRELGRMFHRPNDDAFRD